MEDGVVRPRWPCTKVVSTNGLSPHRVTMIICYVPRVWNDNYPNWIQSPVIIYPLPLPLPPPSHPPCLPAWTMLVRLASTSSRCLDTHFVRIFTKPWPFTRPRCPSPPPLFDFTRSSPLCCFSLRALDRVLVVVVVVVVIVVWRTTMANNERSGTRYRRSSFGDLDGTERERERERDRQNGIVYVEYYDRSILD